MILDEPTATLDAKAEHELFARIGELFADRSADLSYCLLENGRTSPSGSNAPMTLSLTGC